MTATPKWPAGTYGIPRSLSDCPAATGFSWRTGWRYQDTEDFLPSNRHSSNFHLDASVSTSTLKRTFCMKTEKAGDALRPGWPKGTYVASKFFSTHSVSTPPRKNKTIYKTSSKLHPSFCKHRAATQSSQRTSNSSPSAERSDL